MRHSFPPLWYCILLALILLLISSCAAAQIIIVRKPQYISAYDLQTQTPKQVEWVLHSSDMGSVTRQTQWSFTADVPHRLATARHGDYTKSGYHRGHLCPAADRSRSIEDMKATFAMSNVCPQLPHINTGAWKQTENLCRTYAIKYDSVCVLACPVYLNRDTLYMGKSYPSQSPSSVRVPHAFFKAVWCAANDSVLNAWFIFNK